MFPKPRLCRLILCLLLLLPVSGLRAAQESPLRLGAPFRDHAVLQRDMTLPVWGWCPPGERVTVTFAGQSVQATAGADGKWTAWLEPLSASFEPAELTVSLSPAVSTTVSDILVGEVWLASGQSNMQWKVGKSVVADLVVDEQGRSAPIREFEVTSVFAMLHPIEKAEGEWKAGNYGEYSAIAFAFAHRLYQELDVPIGILNCSFSQTAIQAWVPRQGFRDSEDPYTQALYEQVLQTDPSTPEHRAAWDAFYQSIHDSLAANQARIARGEDPLPIPTDPPGNMRGNRDATWLFNGRLSPVVPYAIRGAIWNQGYANMGEGLPYYQNLHSLIRGWRLVFDRPELPVYFHQFYTPGNDNTAENNRPSIGSTAEMRLGTWLARDIPHTGMASQIDIAGAIHYRHKAVPGQRLALHALKNQYGQADIVADGPMFTSYRVEGDRLIVDFEHADGGLVVGETATNAIARQATSTGFADPTIVPDGDDRVTLFFIAGADRVWHPADMRIDGASVILSSPAVPEPRGVSYATGGVGFQPNLYNQALLPATPFIYYDQQLVTSETWPTEKLTVAGETIDPAMIGERYDWRKMPLLSTQFRDRAVLQAGQPVTIWGSVRHDWGHEAEGEAVVHFSFDGIEKTIPVTPGMREWQVTLPPRAASAEGKTLRVRFTIDGALVHERVSEGIIFGDVWYVAAPPAAFTVPTIEASGQIVRVMEREAKRWRFPQRSRYSVAVSTTPENRFASHWKEPEGFAAALGHAIAAKTGTPVGIIFMQAGTDGGRGQEPVDNNLLKSWIPATHLNLAPSLMADYIDLAAVRPGNEYYAENAQRYIEAWQRYWTDYIPAMIASRAVPDGIAWGTYPSFRGEVTSDASQTYNVLTDSFTPAALKGVIFIASPAMVRDDQGANFGPELAALATSWTERFGGQPTFVYTVPSQSLAPAIAAPTGIADPQMAVTVDDWQATAPIIDAVLRSVYP